MHLFLFQIFTSLFILSGCSTLIRNDAPPLPVSKVIHLKHRFYEVVYDPEYRMAKYVKYTMTADRLKKKVARRKDRFQPDPLLKAMNVLAVVPKEYQGSKYDKGHLAPAADFAWDQEANNETFYMSNMVPQSPSLNRSAWKILEEKVRRFACGEGRVTVITGPILKKNMKMTDTGIPIPEQFFKIVFDETPPLKVIAYIYNQTDKGNVTEQRVVPLREVESKVNEKFAPESPEGPLRQPSQINLWKEEAC